MVWLVFFLVPMSSLSAMSLQVPHVVILFTFRFYLIAFTVWASVRVYLKAFAVASRLTRHMCAGSNAKKTQRKWIGPVAPAKFCTELALAFSLSLTRCCSGDGIRLSVARSNTASTVCERAGVHVNVCHRTDSVCFVFSTTASSFSSLIFHSLCERPKKRTKKKWHFLWKLCENGKWNAFSIISSASACGVAAFLSDALHTARVHETF